MTSPIDKREEADRVFAHYVLNLSRAAPREGEVFHDERIDEIVNALSRARREGMEEAWEGAKKAVRNAIGSDDIQGEMNVWTLCVEAVEAAARAVMEGEGKV